MNYFNKFPKIKYPLEIQVSNSTIFKETLNIPNWYKSIYLAKNNNNTFDYQYYRIQDGERPDIVSHKLYGASQYYWTFFLINDHLGIGDFNWPLSYQRLNEKLINEFGNNTTALITNDPIAGKFIIEEELYIDSQAVGKLKKIRPNFGQLILERYSDTYLFSPGDTISFLESQESIILHDSVEYIHSVAYYINDAGRVVDSEQFIEGGDNVDDIRGISFHEHFTDINDSLAHIKVIPPNQISSFVSYVKQIVQSK